MEHLDPKYFACTKRINVKQYFNDFSEIVKTLNSCLERNQFVTNVEEACSIQHLKYKDELCQSNVKTNLCTKLSFVSKATSGHLRIHRVKNKWKKFRGTKQYLSIPAEKQKSDLDTLDEDLIPNQDVLLVVRVYRPFQSKSSVIYNVKYTHEFAILAKQSLTKLRDVIKCVHDFGVSVELEHPDEKITTNTKEDYPSGFIFIENCCYNDMRHPNAIEYSNEIIEWVKNKRLGNITTAKMEEVKLEDMKIRIGYPYLYQHQGNCEHLVVFTDMRLLRPNEVLNSSNYPYVLSYNKFNRIHCMMCAHALAAYNVTECDRLLFKNNYFCKSCVLAYNYRDGKKVGEFKLFPYYDINMASLY